MPQRSLSSSALMRPFVVLALPGMYLFYKYNQYKQQQVENARRKVTERELQHLNHKIDKLLNKLEENEPELATCQEDECVICVNAKATMQTSPCGHRVVCRKCFVKTIQMAVSQRLLPLRCVICRAKILRLKQTLPVSQSWQPGSSSSYSMGKAWGLAGSASAYSVGAHSVPNSASLYSMTSGSSSLSGVSSVSSSSGGGVESSNGGSCGRVCGGGGCAGGCLGAVPRRLPPGKQPGSMRRSHHHSMKLRLQEYRVPNSSNDLVTPTGRLPPIKEFQRDFRASQMSHNKEVRKDSKVSLTGLSKDVDVKCPPNIPIGFITVNANPVASTSTRIRCAQKILTQLETTPMKKSNNYYRLPSKTSKESTSFIKNTDNEENNSNVLNTSKQSVKANEDKRKGEDGKKQEDKNKKEEKSDNKKNEAMERKKEEKLKLKAEKEAKKEAKREAKEEERQAKLLAKEEKKRAKKEAKQALLAEKDKK